MRLSLSEIVDRWLIEDYIKRTIAQITQNQWEDDEKFLLALYANADSDFGANDSGRVVK